MYPTAAGLAGMRSNTRSRRRSIGPAPHPPPVPSTARPRRTQRQEETVIRLSCRSWIKPTVPKARADLGELLRSNRDRFRSDGNFPAQCIDQPFRFAALTKGILAACFILAATWRSSRSFTAASSKPRVPGQLTIAQSCGNNSGEMGACSFFRCSSRYTPTTRKSRPISSLIR